MARIASATDCPCETRTSTCRSLASASSGRCFLLAISVLLRFKPIPEGGPPIVIAGGNSSPCCGVRPRRGSRERWAAEAIPREAAMVRFAALDVSLETTAICVVDEDGRITAEGKLRTCPEAIRGFLVAKAPELRRVGLETPPPPV